MFQLLQFQMKHLISILIICDPFETFISIVSVFKKNSLNKKHCLTKIVNQFYEEEKIKFISFRSLCAASVIAMGISCIVNLEKF